MFPDTLANSTVIKSIPNVGGKQIKVGGACTPPQAGYITPDLRFQEKKNNHTISSERSVGVVIENRFREVQIIPHRPAGAWSGPQLKERLPLGGELFHVKIFMWTCAK